MEPWPTVEFQNRASELYVIALSGRGEIGLQVYGSVV